jgi:hypothetical protein
MLTITWYYGVLTLQHYVGHQGFEYSDNGAKRKGVGSVGVKKRTVMCKKKKDVTLS